MPSLSQWYTFCFVCRCVHEDFAISYFWYDGTFWYDSARHKIQQTSLSARSNPSEGRRLNVILKTIVITSWLLNFMFAFVSSVSLCDLKLWLYLEKKHRRVWHNGRRWRNGSEPVLTNGETTQSLCLHMLCIFILLRLWKNIFKRTIFELFHICMFVCVVLHRKLTIS